MKIGARILKTGIAVGLALYISHFLGLQPITLAGIAACVTVQPSLYRSWQNSLQQIQANIVGAVIGVALAMLLGTQPYVIALGVVIAIGINIQLKFHKSIPLAMVTVLAIMGSPSEAFWEVAADRFLLLFIGVISSILINVFFPPRHEKRLMKELGALQEQIVLHLRLLTETERAGRQVHEDIKKMAERFEELEQLYALFWEENRYRRQVFSRRTRKLLVMRQMVTTCKEGIDTLQYVEKHQREWEQHDVARFLINEELQKLAAYLEKVFLKYEGRIRTHGDHQQEIEEAEDVLTLADVLDTIESRQLLLRVLPVVVHLEDYWQQLERLDRTIEYYVRSQQEELSQPKA
ncbi:FUSC family protein [Numidum massiliense]|uniref:FUSC family protein n=1 Tax=Numidum massiliense TaxID=1522315 RepID=UPI0006D56209|nr:aromatic acid exporter family protein [Numidum massiliense]